MSISTASSVAALLLYLVLIVLVLKQRPTPGLGRVFVAYLVSMIYWQFSDLMATLSRTAETATFWYQVMLTAGVFAVVYFHFTQAYTHARSPRQGVLLDLGYALAGLLALLYLAFPEYAFASMEQSDGGLYVPEPAALTVVHGFFVWLYLGFGLANLVKQYSRSRIEVDRGRLRYLILGISIVFLGTLGAFQPVFRGYPIDVIANVSNAALVAYVVLLYQPFNIPVVFRGGLLYLLPTTVIGGLYFLIFYLAVNLLDPVLGYQVFLISLLFAAVTMIVVRPLWGRTQSWLDRLLFRRKYDATMMLQRLSRTVSSVLDLDELANMILDDIGKTMDVAGAALFLKEEETGEFAIAAARGPGSGEGHSLTGEHPLVKWLAEHRKAMTRHQVEGMPQLWASWNGERGGPEKTRPELYVPLLVRRQLIGILALGPKISGNSYSPDEQLTITTLTNQIAVAVENARLFSREQRRAIESTALLEIARAISSSLELGSLLATVTQKTAEVCGVDRCSILLLDGERDTLVPLMSQFRGGVKKPRLWKKFKDAVHVGAVHEIPGLADLLQESKPALFDESSMSLLPAMWTEPFGIKSLLAVPLVSKNQVTGLMVLDNTSEGPRFTGEQVDLAMTIGVQVAIGIEKARLYEETAKEKERTETIVEQAFAGIMVVDRDLRIVTVNPEAEALSGFTAREMMERRLPELFGPELWDDGSLLRKVITSGERVAPAEATLVGKNGARDILLGITPIPDGYLLNFADITRLKEVDRLKTSIVANVSHELRAPLASIKAYAELLLTNLERDDRELRHRFLSIIDQEADWLTELINALLDLSRLESGQYDAQMKLVSVKEIVESVLALLDIQMHKRDITVSLEMPSDLPSILADKELMTIMVKNLLGNAIKFSLDGGEVAVRARACDQYIDLEFEDHGIGISQEDLPHLFGKFFRAGLARERGIRGTGLGLALAKEAAELHGGKILVVSELGVGTKFTVKLPLYEAAVPDPGTITER